MGSISGTVLATSARSVGGLQVAYVALPPVNHSAPKTAARTTTSPNGAFTLNAVAAGSYMICVQAPVTAAVLDPCVWSPKPLIVTLLPGQNVTGQTIQLQNATSLQIAIADPTGLIVANEGQTPGGHLVFGTWGAGNHFYVRASITSQTKTSRTYQIIVPQGGQVDLDMETKLYKLQDATGAAVTSGTVKPDFPVPTTATPLSLNFQVVGLSTAVSTP